jgi:hypothetical protein
MMANSRTVLSDRGRSQIVDAVLALEFPDNPDAALGKHTMVRHAGPDWSRISEFDQRREELNDRARCPDEKLIDILCESHAGPPAALHAAAEPAAKARATTPKSKSARRFRFER